MQPEPVPDVIVDMDIVLDTRRAQCFDETVHLLGAWALINLSECAEDFVIDVFQLLGIVDQSTVEDRGTLMVLTPQRK